MIPKDVSILPNGISILVGDCCLMVTFYTPGTVRIVRRPVHLDKPSQPSLSVVSGPEPVAFDIGIHPKTVRISSVALSLRMDRIRGTVVITDARKRRMLAECGSSFIPIDYISGKTFLTSQSFRLEDDEAVYGLGQQQNGKFSQRDVEVTLCQQNKSVCIPMIQSSKGYGVFFDNYSPARYVEKNGRMTFSFSAGDEIDYYFMYGGTTDGVVREIRRLTGQVPMHPLWTLGYWQSRERYTSQEEYLDVLKTYRRLGVPVDGMIQDWRYWSMDNEDWNAMAFGNPAFPNPQKMVDTAHRLHAHTMLSIWPNFGPKTNPYREFLRCKQLFEFTCWPEEPRTRIYNAYDPDARKTYWRYLSKIFDLGFDSWWMDATEPEHHNPQSRRILDTDLACCCTDPVNVDFDEPTPLGPLRKVRNAYSLMSTQGVYEHQRATTDRKRVFILTRSAFAGQQRTGAITWSGDIHASWECFAQQIPAGLSLGLCGIPHWNADIGGFFLNPVFPDALHNAAFHELYVRWMQFGCFTSMMRSHGTHCPREIYYFGNPGEPLFDALLKPIKVRYALLPYLYSTLRRIHAEAASLMRPLVADYPEDPKVRELGSEYCFGQSLLIAPVTRQFYSRGGELDLNKTRTFPVYLPKGADFYDFWTGVIVHGGRTIRRAVPLDTIPVYVKAGTILPIAEPVQYAEQKKWKDLEIRIYPGADGTFTLYEDENDNYNYEKNRFSEIEFCYHDSTSTLTVGARKGTFLGMLRQRRFRIVKVAESRGTGEAQSECADAILDYRGKAMEIVL